MPAPLVLLTAVVQVCAHFDEYMHLYQMIHKMMIYDMSLDSWAITF
jgi:hypothetical protein